jgi:8-oxo-dGTP pyrophosphatase MutT (NUDIX family)
MIEPWPLVSSEALGDFRIFQLRRDRRRSPRTGREHDFFIMNSPDWVNVIALTPAGEAILVEQFRHGTCSVDLEVPGGVMDGQDESPVATAVRELREETGYEGEHARILGSVAPNPAILTNTCHTVLIENCVWKGAHTLDPGEDIATRLVAATELPRLVSSGAVRHALVAVAIFHFELWKTTRAGSSVSGDPGRPDI